MWSRLRQPSAQSVSALLCVRWSHLRCWFRTCWCPTIQMSDSSFLMLRFYLDGLKGSGREVSLSCSRLASVYSLDYFADGSTLPRRTWGWSRLMLEEIWLLAVSMWSCRLSVVETWGHALSLSLAPCPSGLEYPLEAFCEMDSSIQDILECVCPVCLSSVSVQCVCQG